MTAATRHRTRTPPRTPGRPDYAALGKLGAKAVQDKIAALRAKGPEPVLAWINEDSILRGVFTGLERIGQSRTTRGYSRMLTPGGKPAEHLMVDEAHTTTILTVRDRVIGGLVRHDVGSPLIQYARKILERLALAPLEWLVRIRRCPVETCPRLFFWDDTGRAVKRACPAHKKAAQRTRRRK